MSDGLRRRELLAGGLGAAAAGTLAGTEVAQAKSGKRPPDRPRTYDVVVVGAGLAGLSAATAIRHAGRSVVVLEARQRVGGRNLDHELAPGKVAELGGEWTGPGQTVVRGLAKELGVATFPTYAKGKNVYYSGGHVQTYTGGIPPASPPTLVELEAIIVELNRMAKSVPAGAAWKAPQRRGGISRPAPHG